MTCYEVKQELERIFDLVQETKNIDPSYNQNLNYILALQSLFMEATTLYECQRIYYDAKFLENNIRRNLVLPNYIPEENIPEENPLYKQYESNWNPKSLKPKLSYAEWNAKQKELVDQYKKKVKKYLNMFPDPNLSTYQDLSQRYSKLQNLSNDPGLLEDVLLYVIGTIIDRIKRYERKDILQEAEYLLPPDEFEKLKQDIDGKIMYFKSLRKVKDNEMKDLIYYDQVVPLPTESDVEKLLEFQTYMENLLTTYYEKSKETFQNVYLPQLIEEYKTLKEVFPRDTQNSNFKFMASYLLDKPNNFTMSEYARKKERYDEEKSKLKAGKKKRSKNRSKKRSK